MNRNIGFRSWFYFRMGWGTYFAFIFAAVNTLTVTYFLAIENHPSLKEIFPTFVHYITVLTIIGIPLLVIVGYIHYKKTSAFKAETDIQVESSPYHRRTQVNMDIVLTLILKVNEMLLKISKNEKITKEELAEIEKFQNQFSDFVKKRSFDDTMDLEYLKKNIFEQ